MLCSDCTSNYYLCQNMYFFLLCEPNKFEEGFFRCACTKTDKNFYTCLASWRLIMVRSDFEVLFSFLSSPLNWKEKLQNLQSKMLFSWHMSRKLSVFIRLGSRISLHRSIIWIELQSEIYEWFNKAYWSLKAFFVVLHGYLLSNMKTSCWRSSYVQTFSWQSCIRLYKPRELAC